MAGAPWNAGAAAGQPGLDPSYGQNAAGQYDYNGMSQDPGLATGYYPTEQAAQSAWYAANPQYGQYANDPLAQGSNQTNAGQQNLVSQLQQQPNGAVAGGYNPLQPAYLNQPATLNATTVNPQYLSPQLMNSLGSGQTINALVGANQPQFQQQDQQMMQMLATSGLAPSSTAGQTAFNNLAQQQLAGMDPSIAAAIQNSQGNQLNAGQFNATTGNTAGQYNANAMNAAAGTNLQNQNNQQLYNANAYNNAGNNYFNAMTGAYNNNANAFNALNSAGLSGGQNLASGQQQGGNSFANSMQGNFPVYSNPFSGLSAAGIGSAGSYPQPTTNNYYNTGTTTDPYGSYDPTGGVM